MRLLARFDESELFQLVPDGIVGPKLIDAPLEVAKRRKLGGAEIERICHSCSPLCV